jgi:hypothetical protein
MAAESTLPTQPTHSLSIGAHRLGTEVNLKSNIKKMNVIDRSLA